MNVRKHLLPLTAIALAVPATVIASGWDYEEEFDSRVWATATLNWASEIHPASPTHSELLTLTPPPREMWCSPIGWTEDCEIWDGLMEDWLYEFLEVDPNDPLPAIDPFPKECSSTCSVW